ncbi:hypothetical protein BG015_010734 [Linnemannia schmuckeri]|uniref:Uncharacterized protein n=1 Tax=Linnemannia schmuckeri TaxID=64567 RepID=A0A9P5RX40_9FUNG|nr:hypothetical protein BG015_010734 [Linnemannia schmuckeri]
MSKNPYFAHLPTWRNRQDLAYAIDCLPTILETLTAFSPLLATYAYPSTSSFSPSSHSTTSAALFSLSCSSYSSSSSTTTSSASCFSSTTPYSSPPSSSLSSCASSSTSVGSLSPAKPKTSAFKERFVLDLAKACHRSLSQSLSSSTSATTTTTTASNTPNTPSRRISDSVQSSQQQQQQQYQDQTNRNRPSPYYPLQFSTRARAMAYLIEILQSLQKEPCGCDLVKGCYCGPDGIEDHEGKAPCYVCGEWYPDRRESSCGGSDGGGAYEADMDSAKGGVGALRQGKAWHEQGSLRHHVAEAKVKKWLDSVWKPPLTPATTPEQENVQQFGLRSQKDLRQCFDYPQHGHQHQHQQQHHHVHMEPGRPWSVHDIEIEARAKSRSRNNSTSSTNSLSFVSTPSSSAYYYPPTTVTSSSYVTSTYSSAPPQQDLSKPAYVCAAGSESWRFNTSSASPSSSSKPILVTPPSQRAEPLFWPPQPTPVDSRGFPSYYLDNQQQGNQARVRTMSCSDAPPPSGSTPPSFAGSSSASLRSSTPPVMRSHSIHTSHVNSSIGTNNSSSGNGRSKPVRASTASLTFAIPQEILDPNYKSPTFRIKSWNPASSASSTRNHPTAASPFNPIASKLAFDKDSSSADPQQEQKVKQALDGWTSAPAQPATAAAPPPPLALSPSEQESVLKSSKMDRLDQENCMTVSPDAGGQQSNTREDLSPVSKTFPTPTAAATATEVEVGVKKSAPFQLNFTSSRFLAAVQAKASMDSNKSVRHETVQKSAAFFEDGKEEVHALPRPSPAVDIAVTSVIEEDNIKDRMKINISAPVVDVVIVTEQVVLRDSDKAVRMEHHEPAIGTITPSKTISTQPMSSKSTNSPLSIEKSASMSPPTLHTSTAVTASVKASSASSASSAASTSMSVSASVPASASGSAFASTLTSQLCSPDPKSPKKETSKNTDDLQQMTSLLSLGKLTQTITVSATEGLLSSTASPSPAGATPVLP